MIEHTAARVVQPWMVAQSTIQNLVSLPNDNKPWPLYVNQMPAAPDRAVVVIDAPGSMLGREMRGKRVVTKPGIQFMVRARTHDEGSLMGLKICTVIDDLLGANVSIREIPSGLPAYTKNYKLSSIQRTSDVLSLGEEEGGSRLLFTVNALLAYGEI